MSLEMRGGTTMQYAHDLIETGSQLVGSQVQAVSVASVSVGVGYRWDAFLVSHLLYI